MEYLFAEEGVRQQQLSKSFDHSVLQCWLLQEGGQSSYHLIEQVYGRADWFGFVVAIRFILLACLLPLRGRKIYGLDIAEEH